MKKIIIGSVIGIIFFICLLFVIVVGILGAVGTGAAAVSNEIEQSEIERTNDIEKLEVLDPKLDGDYITGSIKNTLGKDISSITINFDLYDSDGNKISDTLDMTDNLKMGKTWKFKAYVYDEDVNSFEYSIEIYDF